MGCVRLGQIIIHALTRVGTGVHGTVLLTCVLPPLPCVLPLLPCVPVWARGFMVPSYYPVSYPHYPVYYPYYPVYPRGHGVALYRPSNGPLSSAGYWNVHCSKLAFSSSLERAGAYATCIPRAP